MANLTIGVPQRVYGEFSLSPDSDVPDKKKDQVIYCYGNKQIVFVDSWKLESPKKNGLSLHMQAWIIKNQGVLPTSDNYPVIGGAWIGGQLRWNSTTFNDAKRCEEIDGWEAARWKVPEDFKSEVQRLLVVCFQ